VTENELLDAEGIEPGRQRTPTVLVLDTSGSMEKEVPNSSGSVRPRIDQLNNGLEIFKEEIEAMNEVKREIDVSIVTFGNGVSVRQEFSPVTEWDVPTLTPGGKTPMGGALGEAFDLVEERKKEYRQSGIPYKRPLIWVLTDGEPTDIEPGTKQWNTLTQDIQAGEDNDRFMLFIMTIGEDANTQMMEQLHERVIQLKEGMFKEYFQFLSNSVQSHSSTEKDEEFDITDEAIEFGEMFKE